METIKKQQEASHFQFISEKQLKALQLLKEGKSQEEVAKKFGCSQTTVSRWYRDYASFTFKKKNRV